MLGKLVNSSPKNMFDESEITAVSKQFTDVLPTVQH